MPRSGHAAVFAVAAVLAGVPGLALAQEAPEEPAPAPAAPVAHARAVNPRGSADSRAGAVMPGFETLADGSSRLFVELSKPVTYDTKAARGSVTYVLKGAHVLRRNNTNPLVTVHFNTPVTTAALVPHGHDLWFVVALRADVRPAVSMNAGKDGTAVMRIEMPKGDYLPASTAPATTDAQDPGADPSTSSVPSGSSSLPAPSSAATPSGAPRTHHRRGHGGPAVPSTASSPTAPTDADDPTR